MTQDDLNQIRGVVKEEVTASEQRITKDIGNFIEENLLPQLADKADKTDIDRLERKLDRSLDKDIEQDSRLNQIEAIPAIAHQLTVKKSK
ncbi:MAG: hypothetical protein Q7R49_02925 [Candidatus Daviesbacteria bacterium]|nr:hypothetical protein [Candidatus Daviesbacteria bacterium]